MSFIRNNYFLSEKIKVFPCAYRNSTYDATSRLNTEYNFTHLPHTVDKASYIIKFNDKSKSEPKAELICVIQGYYFEIELDTGDYTTLQNKYLNICVASPSITSTPGTNFIEGPHLCSWYEFIDSIEDALDIEQVGGTVFAGLKISESFSLSREGYQCYALKLNASAMLPISASKIENSAGVPISTSFTTGALNVANSKFTVYPSMSKITANLPVTINGTLDVKPVTTSVLTVASAKVTINKPTDIIGTTNITGTTNIKNSSDTANDGNLIVAGTGSFGDKLTVSKGGTDITGDTQIKKSSSEATDGNLIVAGTGRFGGELYVTNGVDTGAAFTIGRVSQQDFGNLLCADVEVPLFVKNALYVRGPIINIGNTLSVPDINVYGIQPDSSDTKTFTNGILFKINKNNGKIIVNGLRKAASDDESDTVGEIFSIDPKTGITYAKKINAEVEGISANAVNVTTNIAGTPITNIFGSTDSAIDKLKLKTINPGKAISRRDPIKIVVDNNPTKAVEFYRDENNFTIVKADKFEGNATTATAFKETAIIQLTGAVTSNPILSTHGWTIPTTLENNAVTTTKIRDNNVTNAKLAGDITNDKLAGGITNDKLANNRIRIGGSFVSLGSAVGNIAPNKIDKTLYATSLDLSENMSVNSIGNIKVNNASLKSSSSLKIDGTTVKIGDNKLTLDASNGNVVSDGEISANTFNATSDKRLKENIIDYKPEKSILDLPVKKFDFIDGPKNQIGCIAQDLKEICPEIVNENEKGYLSIQENKLVYLLLDEVKKLKNEVEELKRK